MTTPEVNSDNKHIAEIFDELWIWTLWWEAYRFLMLPNRSRGLFKSALGTVLSALSSNPVTVCKASGFWEGTVTSIGWKWSKWAILAPNKIKKIAQAHIRLYHVASSSLWPTSRPKQWQRAPGYFLFSSLATGTKYGQAYAVRPCTIPPPTSALMKPTRISTWKKALLSGKGKKSYWGGKKNVPLSIYFALQLQLYVHLTRASSAIHLR